MRPSKQVETTAILPKKQLVESFYNAMLQITHVQQINTKTVEDCHLTRSGYKPRRICSTKSTTSATELKEKQRQKDVNLQEHLDKISS